MAVTILQSAFRVFGRPEPEFPNLFEDVECNCACLREKRPPLRELRRVNQDVGPPPNTESESHTVSSPGLGVVQALVGTSDQRLGRLTRFGDADTDTDRDVQRLREPQGIPTK